MLINSNTREYSPALTLCSTKHYETPVQYTALLCLFLNKQGTTLDGWGQIPNMREWVGEKSYSKSYGIFLHQ